MNTWGHLSEKHSEQDVLRRFLHMERICFSFIEIVSTIVKKENSIFYKSS